MVQSLKFGAPLLSSKRCSFAATKASCSCSSKSSVTRRDFAGLAAGFITLTAEDARAGLERYLKKKKLDPLETYIPSIILCQSQFQELEAKLGSEELKFQDARSLLRSGPAGSLRSNIRAVAEYAAESGDGISASEAVKLCLRSLEDLDSLLLRRSRDDTSITVDSMKEKLGTSIQALDRLLQTVPAPVLERGKAAARAFLDETPEEPSTMTDGVENEVDIKNLEDLIPRK